VGARYRVRARQRRYLAGEYSRPLNSLNVSVSSTNNKWPGLERGSFGGAGVTDIAFFESRKTAPLGYARKPCGQAVSNPGCGSGATAACRGPWPRLSGSCANRGRGHGLEGTQPQGKAPPNSARVAKVASSLRTIVETAPCRGVAASLSMDTGQPDQLHHADRKWHPSRYSRTS